MSWFTRTFTYSIGKKIIMALTGLFLVAFLIEHVAGNFLLFANDEGVAYNNYSHEMTHSVFIQIVEIFLFLSIIFHAVDGIVLIMQNRGARPQRYAVSRQSPNTLWTARNMIISGSIILLFIIIHLKTFFVPYRFGGQIAMNASGERSIYHEVAKVFESPGYVGFYVFSMVLLAMHMYHGFASAFQTVGVRHPKYYPFLKKLGIFLSIFISAGFAAQPLYFLFFYNK